MCRAEAEVSPVPGTVHVQDGSTSRKIGTPWPSFAYEKPVATVDTNVARVLRRVFFGTYKGEGRREIWSLANTLVPKNGKRAWKFNQAIMELGALVCVARKPKCPRCPVRPTCKTGRRVNIRTPWPN